MSLHHFKNLKFSKHLAENTKPLNSNKNILIISKAFITRRAKMCATTCNYPINRIDFYETVNRNGRNIDRIVGGKQKQQQKEF